LGDGQTTNGVKGGSCVRRFTRRQVAIKFDFLKIY